MVFQEHDLVTILIIEDEWTYAKKDQYEFWVPTNYLQGVETSDEDALPANGDDFKDSKISCFSISSFQATNDQELSIEDGQHLFILKIENEWAFVEDEQGHVCDLLL